MTAVGSWIAGCDMVGVKCIRMYENIVIVVKVCIQIIFRLSELHSVGMVIVRLMHMLRRGVMMGMLVVGVLVAELI